MKNLKNLTLILILLSLLILNSCKKNQEYHYTGKIIPKHKFINFLIDLHKTDATLANLGVWDKNLNNDSLSYYNYLLKKYNINYVDFERSLNYYFKDVEKFQHIYNIIIDSLKNQMYVLDSLQQKKLSKPNLWRGKQIYLIPFKDNSEDSIPFTVNNPKPGIYELSADIMVFDDDKTYNLRMYMAVEYTNGRIDTVSSQIYFRDNQYHKYIIKLRVTDSLKPKKIFGALLSHTKTIYMHTKVRKIKLTHYNFNEMPWYQETK